MLTDLSNVDECVAKESMQLQFAGELEGEAAVASIHKPIGWTNNFGAMVATPVNDYGYKKIYAYMMRIAQGM